MQYLSMGKCSSGLSSVDTIPIQFWDYPLPLQFSPLPHTFTHTHTHVYTHMHTHAHTCTHMYTHLYTCICTHREYLAKKEEIDRMRAEQDQLRKRREGSKVVYILLNCQVLIRICCQSLRAVIILTGI